MNRVNVSRLTQDDGDLLIPNGIKLIFTGIDHIIAKETVEFILNHNLKKGNGLDHLTLVINSPGGNITDGFAIIDAMNGSHIPIWTVGLGQISSCGLMIFMAGTKGKRTITRNTSILSHQWSWGAMGKEHELIAATKEYEYTTERILRHYKNCTQLPEKKIKEILLPSSDIYLNAREAITYKIADQIKEFKQ